MAISGGLLFYAIPIRSYHSIFFRVKVLLLLLAGINAWVFHGGIWRGVSTWDLQTVPPPRARFAGAASLVLWCGIIFAGRLIAYNWFDCGALHAASIQWATGCSGDEERR